MKYPRSQISTHLGFISTISLVLFFIFSFISQLAYADITVVHGRVVHRDGHHAWRYIIIEDGFIQSVERRKPDLDDDDATFIFTKGYIFPGLIDLHTHLTYNLLPLWEGAKSQFSNRFEWRKDPDYEESFKPPYRALKDPETDPQIQEGRILFDEMQAVAGATTLILQSGSIDSDINDLSQRMVVRGTGYPEDLEIDNGKRIMTANDIFTPRKTMPPKPNKRVIERFVKKRDTETLQAFIPHMAEGRTGFLRDHGIDTYSRDEFEAFMELDIFSDPDDTLKPPIALIHNSGMDPLDEDHIDFMKTWNMGIVWSPVSNLLLYGDTLDVDTLMDEEINIALGSDWSPSGSKHVLDEARMARYYLDEIGSDITNVDIFQMMTVNAADMIDLPHMGEIKEGNVADLFILDDAEDPKLNAMDALFNTPVEHISLVLIRGKAVYGDEHMIPDLDDDYQYLPERERILDVVASKVIYVDPLIEIQINDVVERIEDFLKDNFDMKRSNTLSTTDVPYRERISELQEFITETFSDN